MTPALKYDRSAVMTAAWEAVRGFMDRNPNGRLRSVFSGYLREAWVNERSRLKAAREAFRVSELSIDELRGEIMAYFDTPTNGRLPSGGIHNLHQALANKLQEAEIAAKRDIISAAKACEVTFVKADGSRRVMQVQAGALRHHVKGNKATRSGRIASHTRAFRHPNLLPVWDTSAQAIRSVNLATVERIVTRTETHTF